MRLNSYCKTLMVNKSHSISRAWTSKSPGNKCRRSWPSLYLLLPTKYGMNGAKTSYMCSSLRFRNMSVIWKKLSRNPITFVHTLTVKRLHAACAPIAITTKARGPRMPRFAGMLLSNIIPTDYAKSAIWSHITPTTRSTSKGSVGKDDKSWDYSAKNRVQRSRRSNKIPSISRSRSKGWAADCNERHEIISTEMC